MAESDMLAVRSAQSVGERYFVVDIVGKSNLLASARATRSQRRGRCDLRVYGMLDANNLNDKQATREQKCGRGREVRPG